MEKSRPYRLFAAGLLIVALAFGCTAGNMSASAPRNAPAVNMNERIKPLVEKLYLDTKDLEQACLDVRTSAHLQAFQSADPQLGYLQKVALYFEKAQLTAHHLWLYFAIMEDIRPEALIDYYTLGHKALVQAAQETNYDVRFIRLYLNFIAHAEAKQDIRAALDLVDKVRTGYTQLTDALAPLVRQGLPTSI